MPGTSAFCVRESIVRSVMRVSKKSSVCIAAVRRVVGERVAACMPLGPIQHGAGAFIVEQAGGAATDGQQRIMDIAPHKLHQRVPVFLGSKDEVEVVTGYHKG